MTMTKPSSESNTANRIWKREERRSVMARTADIQVRARRGRTTQELHSDALEDGRGTAAQGQVSTTVSRRYTKRERLHSWKTTVAI